MTLQWRFPNNGNGIEFGLDTGDIDIFKKDPIGSLAREICQNSIDANRGINPTRVEFSTFTIKRDDIPGITELALQIKKCYEFRKNDKKEGAALEAIYNTINSERIQCLRISDYNTTGLIGVSGFERKTAFYNLAKTSGACFKREGSGGSKGIGKAAAFGASSTRTLFYSTYTEKEEKGYIGVSKLRSAPLDSTGLRMSVPEGYYGLGDDNFPVQGRELYLDPSFSRTEGDYGTDLYLIGFGDRDNWKTDLIFKLLDSFLVAFIKEKLEVQIDEVILNKKTIKTFIYDNKMFEGKDSSRLKSIVAQYELLIDPKVFCIEKTVKGYGSIKVYVRTYEQGETYKATSVCDIIRWPYMKITSYASGRLIPYSAICIIEKSDLHEALRSLENAEHTEWSWERLEGESARAKGKSLLSSLKNLISRAINEALTKEIGEQTDVAGAGANLPSMENEDSIGDGKFDKSEEDTPYIGRIRFNHLMKNKVDMGNDGKDNLSSSINTRISESDFGDTADFTSYGNGSIEANPNPNPNPDPNPNPNPLPPQSSQTTNAQEDKNNGVKGRIHKLLKGMRAKYMYDKSNNNFIMTFKSEYTEPDCEIVIKEIGESNDKYDVDIVSATVNGKECVVENGIITGLTLHKDQKYVVIYNVRTENRFAAEVEFYANR